MLRQIIMNYVELFDLLKQMIISRYGKIGLPIMVIIFGCMNVAVSILGGMHYQVPIFGIYMAIGLMAIAIGIPWFLKLALQKIVSTTRNKEL